MKKIVALILPIFLIVAAIPVTVFADTIIGTYGVLSYKVVEGEAIITDCDANATGIITIPPEIEGFPVTTIGSSAFSYCYNITEVIIPDSVHDIGQNAFYYCYGLTNVTIPDNVTKIQRSTFSNCKNLGSVYLPSGIKTIEDYGFNECISLSNIILPNGVISLGYAAFAKCVSLTEITIPSSVEYLGIGANVFAECRNLQSIKVDENNPKYCSINGVLFNKRITELMLYPIGKNNASYSIPNGVMSIGEFSFSGCDNLTNIILPDSVTLIEDEAFSYCSNLSDVWYWGSAKQFKQLVIEFGIYGYTCNSEIRNAKWHYSSCSINKTHEFNDLCDESCNTCTYIREDIHVYDNVCDGNCNNCNYIREVPDHIFDNACDVQCNYCDHTREVLGHNYGTDYTCDICKYSKTPDVPCAEIILADSIKLQSVTGCEYSLDMVNWQSSPEFLNLELNTSYTLYQRVAESENSLISDVSGGLTVTTKNGFTVAYDANGGTNAPDSHIKTEGITLTLSSQEPERSGYKFEGWATSVDGKAVYKASDEYIIDSDIVLYAKWLKLCADCGGDGKNPVSCTRCGGDGKIKVNTDITCYTCNGKGRWCAICKNKNTNILSGPCSYCGSTNFIFCGVCEGSGSLSTESSCPDCVSGKVDEQCIICAGTGIVKELKRILVSELPQKVSFSENNNTFSVVGGKITLYYTDETNETIDLLATMISGYDSTVVGSQNLTITYDEKTTTLQTTVKLIQTLIPSSPIVSSFTDTTVTLISVTGCEYSKDGINWQSSNVFTDLSSGTKYTFYQRYVETDTHEASDNSVGTDVTTDKSKQMLVPNAPTVQSFTANSITLNSVSECEYSKDGISWQSSPVFSDLSCGTEYTFYQRYKETSSTYVGKSSAPLTIKTDKGTQSAPSAPILTRKTHNSVTLKAVSGYEYSRDGINWQTSNVFTGLNFETNYMFYQRKAETDKYYAGPSSAPLTVKTLEESQYTPGDLDENEVVTDRDAVHLLYYTFLPDLYPINQDCDFNGDSEVTDRDAIYLLYHTFLPDMYPIG